MRLSASPPYFAPFPGYFQKVHFSDLFVILDTAQFPRGTTWVSRNRFKSHQGELWMTIPVQKKGLGLQRISEVRIYPEGRWRKKHLESLKSAYKHAPFFPEHLPFMETVFSETFERLLDLNLAVIRHLLKHLHLETKVALLSEMGVEAAGEKRLVELCKKTGAERYLAQAPARKYLDSRVFEVSDIGMDFFQPHPPVYPQLWGDFIPNLSTFDLLFNCGPKAREILTGRYRLDQHICFSNQRE